MHLKKIISAITAIMLCSLIVSSSVLAQQYTITKIAFGSCNKHDLPQPLWKPITQDNPEVFMWLGDIIYGDTHDMALLKQKYMAQNAIPAYQTLKEKSQIIGVWDDHDYGINDGGKFYSKKEESLQLLLDFLDEKANSPRRKQQGAYASYEYGIGAQKVKVILLDARFNRDTLYTEDKVYQPNLTGSILGEEQWAWLEQELRNSTAQVNLIASGIQYIPTEHPYEKWSNFPNERKKLFDLIAKSNVKNPILISGDRHIAEISKWQDENFPNGIYEVTSSGLTHVWRSYREEYNPYRVGNLIASLHYGLAVIDWETKEVILQIKGEEGQVYLEQKLPIN
ncbi:alkaline phosphatase D family protein [Mongoliitalea daihaiensis]|uniref:alkaline phosphatase D family protein n=1 Tax=Mongoliitalea daihaiensis TaxID=2782006 RepID=UPI001F46878D|nr:alkaline phosphatase D family protein [Mongoliitalea daihaiensis]UJP65097.1 alkaline phosphatase family protein [Mongoliitalea daihaiensis]